MTLARVQSFLKDALRGEEPIPERPELAAQVALHVAGNERLTPAEQADIYRRQFFLRHVEALGEDHVGLAHLLGEDGFDALARAYLAAHPPRTPSLRDLGADMASFTARWDGIPAPLREVCADMARYELCIVDLFDAADVAPPDRARLAAIPEDAWLTRPLVWTPLLRLLSFGAPIPELRRAIKLGEALAGPPAGPPARDPSFYGIFRRDEAIAYERMSPEAFDLLGRLVSGESLASACDSLSRSLSEEAAARVEAGVAGWLQRWASWGWILDVERR